MNVHDSASANRAAGNLAELAIVPQEADKPKLRLGQEGFRFSPKAPGIQAALARFEVAGVLSGIGKHFTCTYGTSASDMQRREGLVRKAANSLASRLRWGKEVRPEHLKTFRQSYEFATRPQTHPEAAQRVAEVEAQQRAERREREAAGIAARAAAQDAESAA